MRRWVRVLMASAVVGLSVVAFAAPAGAAEPPDDWNPDLDAAEEATPSGSTGPALSGACNGRGVLFSDSKIYDAKKVNYVEIEAADGISWQGWLDGFSPGDEGPDDRPFNGKVFVNVAGVDIEVGSWGPDGKKFGDSGIETWDFPLDIVKGIEIPVSGWHNEAGARVCSGSGILVVKGTSPLAYVSAGLMAFALVGVVISIIPRGS